MALLAPTPAFANLYLPSFVQIVTNPLTWSLYVVTLVVTVPVILVVSTVEALILRRYAKGIGLRPLVLRYLAPLNAVTSLIGACMMPHGTEIWTGIPSAWALTAILEAVLMAARFRKVLGRRRPGEMLRISAAMNAGSYGLLAAVLAALIYLPTRPYEGSGIRSRAQGRLVLPLGEDLGIIHPSGRPPGLRQVRLGIRVSDMVGTGENGLLAVSNSGQAVRIALSPQGCQDKALVLPDGVGAVTAVSPTGRMLCCDYRGKPAIIDARVPRLICRPRTRPDWCAFSPDDLTAAFGKFREVERGRELVPTYTMHLVDLVSDKIREFRDAWPGAFSPTAPLYAWARDGEAVIYNHATGTRRTVAVPGTVESSLAWSPDGRYIAYAGHPNPFTHQHWNPEIRVVDVQSGRSTTVCRGVYDYGAGITLAWLP